MIVEQEQRLANLPGLLLDLDLTATSGWVGVAGDTRQQSLLINGQITALPQPCNHPLVRSLGDDLMLIVDIASIGPAANAWVITATGHVRTSFDAGRGIQDVLVAPQGIVVTYHDEGVFGRAGPGQEGVALFDHDGRFQWGYQSRFGATAVPIDDCYCAALTEDGQLVFAPYVDFPLVRLDLDRVEQEVWSTPNMLHGSSALTTRGEVAYYHGPYGAWRDILRWPLGTDTPTRVGQYTARLRGLPGGRFLAIGDAGYTVITLGKDSVDG